MRPKRSISPDPSKARTGIEGFDEITNGGLPRGRTTLIEGGPGSGKTIMALQSLVNGVRLDNEAGIFVAFEERSEQIISNAAKFGWNLEALMEKDIFFLDAQPNLDLVLSGSFDLCGMLTAIEVKMREINARRIVFDAIDVVLSLLPDPASERREIYRINEWLMSRGLTGIVTSKAGDYQGIATYQPQLGFLQFMVDCAVSLNHEMNQGISQRSLRVIKYRSSSHSENESPFVIGNHGLEVADTRDEGLSRAHVSEERISSGVERLDTMLGGGYYRDASILITGPPGAAKSTLSGTFAEAACMRGERTLFVSFESDTDEVVRNLASVNIKLETYLESGLLRMVTARTNSNSAEILLMRVKSIAREHRARCLVIDPLSALSKGGDEANIHSVAERLLDWTKAAGVTLVCTSLYDETNSDKGSRSLQISTLSDTWIHLSYLVCAGERNRGLAIVKSRGTAHSNQVRELVLGSSGVVLTDVYVAGGEVLMGTLRWQKERAEGVARLEVEAMAERKKLLIDTEEAELEARLHVVQRQLDVKRTEKQALLRMAINVSVESTNDRDKLNQLRGVDKT